MERFLLQRGGSHNPDVSAAFAFAGTIAYFWSHQEDTFVTDGGLMIRWRSSHWDKERVAQVCGGLGCVFLRQSRHRLPSKPAAERVAHQFWRLKCMLTMTAADPRVLDCRCDKLLPRQPSMSGDVMKAAVFIKNLSGCLCAS